MAWLDRDNVHLPENYYGLRETDVHLAENGYTWFGLIETNVHLAENGYT